jgi:2-desacetyl-2-hydroxyethyl bacteriochlorophyllide A dehydrogenase
MKAAVLYDPEDLRVEELERPSINADEVLIRVKYCGICGSDLHLYEGKWKVNSRRVVMGHEFSGEIEEIGENVTGYSPGDRVVVDPNIICGECYYCRLDSKNYYCTNRKVIGWEGWLNGGFSELLKAPQKVVYRLPRNVTFMEAVMTEPLACALRGIDNVQVKCGDKVVILGAGSMGLMMLQLMKIAGASWVCVTDLLGYRLKRAKEFGADLTVNPNEENVQKAILEETDGRGVDVVIEAAGTTQTVAQAVGLIRRGGKVCLFGVVPQEETVLIRPFDLYYKEALLVSSFCNPFTFQRALDLLGNKKVNISSLITHTYPLKEIRDAFHTMQDDEKRCKVVIEV